MKPITPQLLFQIRDDFFSSAFKNELAVGIAKNGIYDLETDIDFILTWIGYSI